MAKNEKVKEICKAYGTTPEHAKVLVCEGRRVGFILSYGTIDSKNCFLTEKPAQSYRNPRPTGHITLIPNGWRVSVVFRSSEDKNVF